MYSATLHGLAAFPPELLENIVNYISNAADLLSLALTNSTFQIIIIPFHLHYRTVRCFANDSAIWNHLLENQRRLQNVQTLELYPPTSLNTNMYFDRDCLPRILRNGAMAPHADLSLILSAIKQMTYLKCLRWHNQKTLLHFQGPGLGNLAEECWDAVSQHCQELQEVVAKSSRGCCDCAVQRGESQTSTKLFNLRRLTSLSYTVFCTEPGHSEYNSHPLISFLASNPKLQILRLATSPSRALTQPFNPQGLFQLRFSSLRTFSLTGKIKTISAPLLIDFFDANPLLESVHLGQTVSIAMSPTTSGTHLLPSLKHISTRPAALVAWFLGDLPDGTARPLVSISVSVSIDEDSENNTFFGGMSRAVGEGLEALSISFDIPEPTINWTNLISDISFRCPNINIRRLDVKGSRGSFGQPLIEERSHPNPNSFDYWVAPLQKLRNLELLNVPNGFFEYLVIQTQEKLRFNQDAILSLTRTCPSLRLINGSFNQRFVQQCGGLIYLRPASGSAKLISLEKHTRERLTTGVELSDEGQSADFTWQLYSVHRHASILAEDLWRVFLPHYDSLRFAC